MPTYQYRCNDCRYEFNEFQSITADPLSVCPECDGNVERLISGGAGFLFKGDGFYITDYRSDSYKKAEKADKESGTSKTEGSKSDSDSSSGSSKTSGKSKSEGSSKVDSSSGSKTSE